MMDNLNLGSIAELMKNAGKLRENMEKATEALSKIEVEGSAGGGAVVAKVNGRLELRSIRIDPKLLQDGDHELLEDLVTAAVNQGLTRARETAAQSLSNSLPFPPGLLGTGQ